VGFARVLIVDDEAELVGALAERLRLRGFEATGATSGEAALAHLVAAPCDVVLLDLKMPGLGGLEVLRRIRERRPELPVILLSGYGATGDADRGMQLGAYDYLMKPVVIDDLVRVLTAAGARGQGGAA
jgi:DNA-binding response OmpR family regulator